tara:strand:+ start:1552 stop:2901 length:1350 start_codon:yes stop_codon:yes gene_type:complete
MSAVPTKPINKDNLPSGKLVNSNTLWEFPIIEKYVMMGSNKKKYKWILYVELNEDNQRIKIYKNYFNAKELQDTKYTASYFTEYGVEDGNKTISSKTIVTKGKNIGKINQTNVFTQCLMDARSKYNKKFNENEETEDIAPMLLAQFNEKKITFNNDNRFYVQKKLNGIRAIYNFSNESFTSRQKKKFPEKEHLIDELKVFNNGTYYDSNGNLIDNTKLLFDGELYVHGVSLENINSLARSETSKSKIVLEYHVFDVIYLPLITTMSFNERVVLLNSIFQSFKSFNYIKKVTTLQVNCIDIITSYNRLYLEEGYEGTVLRFGNGIYEPGNRSKNIMKIKPTLDEDMPLVGFTASNTGKEKNAIIFILDAGVKGYKDKLPENKLKKILTGNVFNIIPKWPIIKRQDLYNELIDDNDLFINKYYGVPVRIEFEEYSLSGVPLRAKAVNLLVQ